MRKASRALVGGRTAMGFAPMTVTGQVATPTVTATPRDGMTPTQALPAFALPAPTM